MAIGAIGAGTSLLCPDELIGTRMNLEEQTCDIHRRLRQPPEVTLMRQLLGIVALASIDVTLCKTSRRCCLGQNYKKSKECAKLRLMHLDVNFVIF